jgi:hypothetical protein
MLSGGVGFLVFLGLFGVGGANNCADQSSKSKDFQSFSVFASCPLVVPAKPAAKMTGSSKFRIFIT